MHVTYALTCCQIKGLFMWNITVLCRAILFIPLFIGYITLCVIGCSGKPQAKYHVQKQDWYLDFEGIDLVRYDSLLQLILDDIKQDCFQTKKSEDQTKSLVLGFLLVNGMITFAEIYPASRKDLFMHKISKLYDQIQPILDNSAQCKN